MSLTAFRCDGIPTVTSSTIDDMSIAETFNDAASIGLRWNIERYGLQRLEFVVSCKSNIDLYDRLNNHLGHRIGVVDSTINRVITGFATSVEPVGSNRVKYVAKGPYIWLYRDLVDSTIYATTSQISASIQTLLTNNCEATGSNYDNIASNTTQLGGYQNRLPEGNYPGDIIKAWLNKSDSSSNIYDFWLVDSPLDGLSVQEWIPHYAARSSTAAIDWQVDINELSRLTQSRDINDLRTDVNVYYGTITGTQQQVPTTQGNSPSGTHDGANNSADLIDSTTDFVQFGVQVGDRVVNTTDNCSGYVSSISTTTNPNDTLSFSSGLSGGSDDDFDTGDGYSVKTRSRRGQHDGANNLSYASDASYDYSALGVYPGDLIENITDDSSGIVERLSTNGASVYLQEPLSEGTDNDFDTNDYFVIRLNQRVIDTTINFLEEGVKPGDRVTNIDDGSRGVVTAVFPTTLTLDRLSGGTDNRWTDGDEYSIEMQDPQKVSTATTTADYWSVDYATFERDMTETQADQYRDALLNTDPTQRQSFIITSPTIRDGNGGRWPLWEVIAQGGGYIRINDLYPAAALFTTSTNNITTFFITALDYNYANNTLRVQVDNPDERLDARLRRAQILQSEMINADPLPPGSDEFNPFN